MNRDLPRAQRTSADELETRGEALTEDALLFAASGHDHLAHHAEEELGRLELLELLLRALAERGLEVASTVAALARQLREGEHEVVGARLGEAEEAFAPRGGLRCGHRGVGGAVEGDARTDAADRPEDVRRRALFFGALEEPEAG